MPRYTHNIHVITNELDNFKKKARFSRVRSAPASPQSCHAINNLNKPLPDSHNLRRPRRSGGGPTRGAVQEQRREQGHQA
jgi:hypothetical protein